MVNKKKYKYIKFHENPKHEFYEALELLFPRLTSPKLVEWAAEMLMGHLSFDTLCANRSKYLGPITSIELAQKREIPKYLRIAPNRPRMSAADRVFSLIAMRTTYKHFHEILGRISPSISSSIINTVDYSSVATKKHYATSRYINICKLKNHERQKQNSTTPEGNNR